MFFPSGRQPFAFPGEIAMVCTEAEAEGAVFVLRDAPVVGVVVEWYAPGTRGVSPSPTALIQICSSESYCAIFFMRELQMKMPLAPRKLLCDPAVTKVPQNCASCL